MQQEFKTPTEYILKQRKKSLQRELQETKKQKKRNKIQIITRINQRNLSILLTEVCVLRPEFNNLLLPSKKTNRPMNSRKK